MHLTRKRIKCTIYGVLSVSKLTPARRATTSAPLPPDRRLLRRARRVAGDLTGRGAAGLGLDGVVEDGQLRTLIRGDHPLTGKNLRRRHPKARTITVEKIDPASGERRREEKTLRPVAGFDLVFSVPKSATSHAPRRRADQAGDQRGAHRRLAGRARLPRGRSCVVRRGTGGVAREHGEGFVAAAYQHRTSRAQGRNSTRT